MLTTSGLEQAIIPPKVIPPKVVPNNQNPGEKFLPKKSKEKTEDPKPTCKFYTNGRCNRNNECKFSHPRICRKFSQSRLLDSLRKGYNITPLMVHLYFKNR